MKREQLPIALAGLVVAITRIFILPRGFWEGEEIGLAASLLTFDPYHQQPEAPGYPLLVGVGRFLNFFVRDPFVVLTALSLVASIAGAIFLARATAIALGSAWSGAAAALFLYLSPSMLVFSPLPNAESVSVALVAATFYFFVTRQPIWFAAAAAASIGCRPQLALAMGVFFVIGLMSMPKRRQALAVFAAIVLVTFAVLVEAIRIGRVREYIAMNIEAARVAHEGATLRELAMRFTAHPWGSKYLAFPILIAAGFGLRRLAAAFKLLAPFALFGAIHAAFCILTGSMTDGVQPIIPALPVIAVFAAAAFTRFPAAALTAAVIYGGASFVYAWPLLDVRAHQSSPAMRAARFAASQNAVVLPDPALQPHAMIAGARMTNMGNFDDFVDQPDTRVMLLVDGASSTPGAEIFTWPDSDIYGKITTERYRIVSAVPVPPSHRYRARLGVYPYESAPDRGEWRWLAQDAVIELPHVGGSVTLRFALPEDAPIDANEVKVGERTVRVTRGGSAELVVPYSPRLVIRSSRGFVGPDGRNLAVQLTSLVLLPRAGEGAPERSEWGG